MYKGSNPIAIKSQQMMLDALNELLKEKEYKDITISEICERSTISRQTFYKLFGTKENLLLFQLENSPYVRHTEQPGETPNTLTEICVTYSKYVIANYEQLKMLLENDLTDVLFTQMYTSMSTCRSSFVGLSETEREYAAQFMSAGLCRLTQRYILEHEKPEQEELIRLSYKIMSGKIYRV